MGDPLVLMQWQSEIETKWEKKSESHIIQCTLPESFCSTVCEHHMRNKIGSITKKQIIILPHKSSCSNRPWECNSENREVISESYSTRSLDQSFEKFLHYDILLTSIHTSNQIRLMVSSLWTVKSHVTLADELKEKEKKCVAGHKSSSILWRMCSVSVLH